MLSLLKVNKALAYNYIDIGDVNTFASSTLGMTGKIFQDLEPILFFILAIILAIVLIKVIIRFISD
jgi:hypothetical protein